MIYIHNFRYGLEWGDWHEIHYGDLHYKGGGKYFFKLKDEETISGVRGICDTLDGSIKELWVTTNTGRMWKPVRDKHM